MSAPERFSGSTLAKHLSLEVAKVGCVLVAVLTAMVFN
ncbi:Uncharacterised protein [Slackia heliotrinireducens]|jgi:hypothetical protein|uniref:Uncharacterized protein n=1 Tax=Slackia heliotrinireducens (strain ATCC 29202 / DSM 20476 / NCTC 11029 / RHS 1) TaxID=471855 RepID=C7N608_SLAHD|nr:hypothetical protein Shel_13190 [Slackia heliotrinireducens DSM 20476]VEH00590.1 Uncharacterised protein [Slackia heliotrinireducens]